MSKVYVLKYYYNQYDQLDGYTVAIWKDKPDFHKIKEWFEREIDCLVDSPENYARGFKKVGVDLDAVYGRLARGEELSEFDNGGDGLEIVEEELL
ncbi:conserved hypothetical protein [Vibrio phage 193E37-1]|nr:conserved hypothetical protein [Vibrio phage 193E37-1]